jgi:integrase
MPRRAVAAISRIKIGDKPFFRLTYPTPQGRKREHFADEKAAKKRLAEVLLDAKRHGTAAASMSSELRADAIAAAQELNGTNCTLLEAARFFRAHLERESGGESAERALDAFVKSRDGCEDRYRRTLGSRMKFAREFFANQTVGSITTDHCQRLLESLDVAPRTKAHFRAHLSAFFRFAQSRGWVSSNPIDRVPAVRVADPEVEILTPKEAESLLGACDPEILPGVALGLFCGMRQAEIERMEWRAIDLKQKIVSVGARIAKTNSRRVIQLPPNAVAWLSRAAAQEGKVWPAVEKARDRWTLARIRAGFGPLHVTSREVKDAQLDPSTGEPKGGLRPWPQNALRHSAISYRVALERDLAKIAYECGTSPAVIQRHYNGLASPKAARAFFKIWPSF